VNGNLRFPWGNDNETATANEVALVERDLGGEG
jgi:hypothetical protein